MFLILLVGGQMVYYTFFVEEFVNGNVITKRVLSDQVIYSGYILAFVAALAILVKGVFWKILLLLFLCCSLVGIVAFTEHIFMLGIGGLKIRIFPLSLLLLHLILNQDMLPFLSRSPGFDEEIVLQTQDDTPTPEKIAFFEKKFETKSTEDLVAIIELNELVPEAILASKNILEKRK